MENKEFLEYAKSGLAIGLLILCIIIAIMFPIPAVILAVACKVFKGLK